jgi:hypothetical protein
LCALLLLPVSKYEYAAGKNTSGIALALNVMEAIFDNRADTFYLVISDSLTLLTSATSCENAARL